MQVSTLAAPHSSAPREPPTAATCEPGTRHGLAGPGSCCQVRSTSTSCNSDAFDHIAELAGYAQGALFWPQLTDASSLRGLRLPGALSESWDVAHAHPERALRP